MKKYKFILLFVLCFVLASTLTAQEKFPGYEERIYSLSLIWKELHYSFAFPENLKQANLESLYIAYLPKMKQVTNNYEYYRTLSSFMAHFNDAHTRIYCSPRPDDLPPVTTTNFGEKVVVSNIAKNMADKIPIGSQIIQVNNMPVVEYIKDSIYPYISAATPHWKFDKAVTEMFYGKPGSTLSITIRTPKGKEREVKMTRNYNTNGAKEVMADTTQLPPIVIKIIDKNIGYIQLNSFLYPYIKPIYSEFYQHLAQLRKCEGLIIDVRGNRGGTDQAWENLAYYLIPESQSHFQVPVKCFSRKHIPTYKMWGEYNPQFKDYYSDEAMEEIKHPPYTNKLRDSLKLHQPLVILSGQYVGSAAEDFLLTIKGNRQATIVGGPSVGCMGEPMFISLPGEYEVMMCIKKYVNLDGSQPNVTGVLPDIEVEKDYSAYLKGKDNQLERALEEVRELIGKGKV